MGTQHPYEELAQFLEQSSRGAHEDRHTRSEAAELRRLARIDKANGWPWEDGTPPDQEI